MHPVMIMDIALRIPKQELESALLQEESNYTTATITHDSKELVMKLSGKNMYQITFKNSDADEFCIVAEVDDRTGDIVFMPNRIKNRNKSFYSCTYMVQNNIGTDSDPAMFFVKFFQELSVQRKGSFAWCEPDGNATIIVDGSYKKADAMAIVDEDGRVYSVAGAKSIKHSAEDGAFHIQTPINVWLKENPAVAVAVSSMSDINDKMNYIGQYLISARLKDEIESDEFIDIFRQAGIFGFSKESVQNIYKLLT